MSGRKQKTYMVDFIFTLSLFGVFAVSALLVLVIGANVYRSTVNTQEANAMKRTAIAYIAEKIRQNDTSGSISAGEVEGCPALILKSEYGKESYSTYIYTYNGSLRELFMKSSAVPALIAGQEIAEISGFSVDSVSDHLYRTSVTDKNGQSLSLYINTKSS